MAKPTIIPPMDATPEDLARMLLQPPKEQNPTETADNLAGGMPAKTTVRRGALLTARLECLRNSATRNP